MTLKGVHHAHLELMPGVELYVYALKGERYSVMFDTGVATMKTAVLALASEVAPLAYVLHTVGSRTTTSITGNSAGPTRCPTQTRSGARSWA